MTETIDYAKINCFNPQGRNKYVCKYLVTVKGMQKKYCSLGDISKDPELEHYKLNRQKIYRIRKEMLSAHTKYGRHKYDDISITNIKNPRKYIVKHVRVLVE